MKLKSTLIYILCLTAATLLAEIAASPAEQFQYAPAPCDNPLKGLVPYSGAGKEQMFPHSMEFSYLPLSALVKGEGKYNWDKLEQLLSQIGGRGHQAIFRIYLEYPGRSGCIPEHLIKGGLKVHKYKNTNTAPFPPKEIETPDYENQNLRKCLRDFIAAMGAKYDGDPRIGFITAGLLGTWGEWHTYPRNDLWASKKVQGEVMDAYELAFKSTPVLLRYPAGKDHYDKTDNAERPFGYHDDSFAWATLDTGKKKENWYYMTALRAAGRAAVDKWKSQPIGGEIRPEAWGQVFDPSPKNKKIQDFEQCVKESHASWLMDTGMFQKKTWSEERRKRGIAQVQRMGYEYYISKAAVDVKAGKLSVLLTVENRGVAPFYYVWPMVYELLSENGESIKTFQGAHTLKGLLPGEHQLREEIGLKTLPVGRYKLTIRVANPLKSGKPVIFANQGVELESGRLTVGTVVAAE